MKNKTLIIESDPRFAVGLQRMLSEIGSSSKVCSSAGTADMMMLMDGFDVVFIDIDQWAGLDTLFIRLVARTVDGTRIILTSHKRVNRLILKKAMRQGVYACIRKPFAREEVFAVMGRFPDKAGSGPRTRLAGTYVLPAAILLALLAFLAMHPVIANALGTLMSSM